MSELRTSQDWFDTLERPLGTIVLDPDGWDRQNFKFSWGEELITKEEFTKRMCESTCMFNKDRWSVGNVTND